VDRPGRPDLFDLRLLSQSTWPAYAEHVVPPIIDKWEQRNSRYDFGPLRRNLRAVRTDRYKYIEGSDDSRELYDLEADPHETTNVMDTSSAAAEELSRKLADWVRGLHIYRPDTRDDSDSPEVSQRLRDLGYL
jgi:arylsulfatase A-like enzyme